MIRVFLPAAVWLFICLSPVAGFPQNDIGADAVNGTAVQLVEGLHALLLESMKAGDRASCRERFEMLEPYIMKSFDFPLISRIVLGRWWKKMDLEKRKEFIDAFSRMTVATYADRFDSWSGEVFKTVRAGLDSRGHMRVETVLVKKGGEEISLDYGCRREGGRWKIVSVSAKGVNDLSVKRADYSSFLRGHTVDELISRLEEHVRKCVPAGTEERRQAE